MANINGLFLPSTYQFDVSSVSNANISPELTDLFIRLYSNIRDIINAVNAKETGTYVLTEFTTSKSWYPNTTLTSLTPQQASIRPVYRVVVVFGALLNNATKSVTTVVQYPSTSPTNFRVKIIECCANKITTPFAQVPIPYSSTAQPVPENIELWLDTVVIDVNTVAVQVNIATISVTTDWTEYTDVEVVLEYITQ